MNHPLRFPSSCQSSISARIGGGTTLLIFSFGFAAVFLFFFCAFVGDLENVADLDFPMIVKAGGTRASGVGELK